MSLKRQLTAVLLGLVMVLPAVPAWAQQTVRIVGTVRDETNAIALPGTPVEVTGTTQVVYTNVFCLGRPESEKQHHASRHARRALVASARSSVPVFG